MENKHINKCFVCKNIKYTNKFKKQNFDYFECKTCKTIYVYPKINKNIVKKVYNKDYFSTPQYYFDYLAEEKNIRVLAKKILLQLQKLGKKNGKILEIGCATGFFLSEAKKQGFSVQGVEISKFACNYAKERFGLKIFNGIIEDFKTKSKYDVIVLLDVIEHVLSLKTFMTKIKKLCKKGTIIIISTPITDSPIVKLLGKKWVHYRPEHIFYFNRDSIKQFLTNENFNLLKTGYLKREYKLRSIGEKLYLINKILGKIFTNTIKLLGLHNKSITLDFHDIYMVYAAYL